MLYLDSSALVKRYVAERGSPEVAAQCASRGPVYTSSLSYAEVVAALARKYREHLLSQEHFDVALNRFLDEWRTGINEIPLDREILTALPLLFREHPLKGSDGVHLASALRLQKTTPTAFASLVFGVADEKLARAAAASGLPVFNPEIA